ncbi:MAG: zinc ribbon domain-containing protein [Propionibacteriaceae bacterium]|nr:zinc ribbon domain-containing protein [Propionibacteriaceae bacterium]
MPTYQYHCKDCAADLEIVQRMTDPTLTECPSCQGRLRKVFSAVGVVFKGSGFYATDNRTKGATQTSGDKVSADSAASPSGANSSPANETSSAPKAESKASDSAASSSTSASSSTPAKTPAPAV